MTSFILVLHNHFRYNLGYVLPNYILPYYILPYYCLPNYILPKYCLPNYCSAFLQDPLPLSSVGLLIFLSLLKVIFDKKGTKALFIYKTHFWNHALKTRFLFSKKRVFLQITLLETTLKNTLLLNKMRVFKAWFQKCVL